MRFLRRDQEQEDNGHDRGLLEHRIEQPSLDFGDLVAHDGGSARES